MELKNITEQELQELEDASEAEWDLVCNKILASRAGQYPPDWWEKVKQSGLMDRVAARWGKPDAFDLRVIDLK